MMFPLMQIVFMCPINLAPSHLPTKESESLRKRQLTFHIVAMQEFLRGVFLQYAIGTSCKESITTHLNRWRISAEHRIQKLKLCA